MAFTVKVASSIVVLASMLHMLCVGVVATNESNASENDTATTAASTAAPTQAPNTSQNDTVTTAASTAAPTQAPNTSQNDTVTTAASTAAPTQAPNTSQNDTATTAASTAAPTQAPNTSQNDTATTAASTAASTVAATQAPNMNGTQTTAETTEQTTAASTVAATQATTAEPTETTMDKPTMAPATTPDLKKVKEAKVSGTMTIEVSNTTVSDPKLKTSIQEAIAYVANMSKAMVEVKVSEAKVDYTITVENVEDHDPRQTVLAWASLTKETMSQTINTMMQKNGATGSVTVTDLPIPELEYIADAFDDSTPALFQLGNVVFVSVLSLALRPVVQ